VFPGSLETGLTDRLNVASICPAASAQDAQMREFIHQLFVLSAQLFRIAFVKLDTVI
jgi:hypothetical protein